MFKRPTWLRGSLVSRLDDTVVMGRLDTLVDLILKAPLNLSGFRSDEALWMQGIYDAVQTVQEINLLEVQTAVDIGSGAGLPGLVLAILAPNVRWTLIEAREKRAKYLEHMVDILDLGNVGVICGRAEEIVGDEGDLRENAEVVTARAVGSLRVALELLMPYLKVGGKGFFPKGRKQVALEIPSAKDLCLRLGGEDLTVSLPYGDGEGSQIIVVTKTTRTPREFPRRWKKLGSPVSG